MESDETIQRLASILKNVQNGLIRSYATWILLGTVAVLLYIFYFPELERDEILWKFAYILSLVTYLPALAAWCCSSFPRGSERAVKYVAFLGFPGDIHPLAPSRLSF